MNDIVKEIIRNKLMEARVSENLTQKLVAKFIGVRQMIISKIEVDYTSDVIADCYWRAAQCWSNSGLGLKEYYDKYHPLKVSAMFPEGEPEDVVKDLQEKEQVAEKEQSEPILEKALAQTDKDMEMRSATLQEMLKGKKDNTDPNDDLAFVVPAELRRKTDLTIPRTKVLDAPAERKSTLLSEKEFYLKVWQQRFEQVRAAIEQSLLTRDAIRPDWVKEYNDLYGKIEDYRP